MFYLSLNLKGKCVILGVHRYFSHDLKLKRYYQFSPFTINTKKMFKLYAVKTYVTNKAFGDLKYLQYLQFIIVKMSLWLSKCYES